MKINKNVENSRETALIAGMCQGRQDTQYELYAYCADYYFAHYLSLFVTDKETADEIFQQSFITLWEMMESGRLYVHNSRLMYGQDKPMKSSLQTFFMGIAKKKYQEYVRTVIPDIIPEHLPDENLYEDLSDSSDSLMADILACLVDHMPRRCKEILTKFYYESKNLDEILQEIPDIESKDALKTRKYKCLETLRKKAYEMYGMKVKNTKNK